MAMLDCFSHRISLTLKLDLPGNTVVAPQLFVSQNMCEQESKLLCFDKKYGFSQAQRHSRCAE
jgi:hypothetical protein